MKVIAKALLQRPDGTYLLLRRGLTHPRFPHHLDLPGGEVESGETFAVAVSREIFEETGLHISPDELTIVFNRIVNGDRCMLYTGKVDQATAVTLSWEHDQALWLPAKAVITYKADQDLDSYYLTVADHLSSYAK